MKIKTLVTCVALSAAATGATAQSAAPEMNMSQDMIVKEVDASAGSMGTLLPMLLLLVFLVVAASGDGHMYPPS